MAHIVQVIKVLWNLVRAETTKTCPKTEFCAVSWVITDYNLCIIGYLYKLSMQICKLIPKGPQLGWLTKYMYV
jgi:hypothetical protein